MAGEHVLVIDDSPTILKVVQLVLTKAGFTVTTAPDGDEGIEEARRQPPDVILLDFVMPRLNGYQVCQALHDEDNLKDVPVILMSAKGDQVGDRFVKVMGIVDYITKPFSPEAITGIVRHTIDKYRRRGDASDPATILPESSPEEAAAAAAASM
ncbi:MAG: response regulator, partial [Deltaproteobacteria bacterium]|nr:response regulator [Deltaproteobacteria bacterium]